MTENPVHLRHEADFLRRMEERAHRRIAGRDDPNSVYLTWAIENRFETIQSIERAAFRLPTGAVKLLGGAEAQTLQDLLFDVWEINERFVGEPQAEAFVAINGMPEQHEIIERGLAWARRYVASRLERRNCRDQGCPFRKFVRLYNELVPFLDMLGTLAEPGGEPKSAATTGQLLGEVCDFIAWSFFEGTWGPSSPGGGARRPGSSGCPTSTPRSSSSASRCSRSMGGRAAVSSISC